VLFIGTNFDGRPLQCHLLVLQAVHYTVPNQTDSTRVSFDIRVVPLPLFEPEWTSPTGAVPFRLGQYYRCTDAQHTALALRCAGNDVTRATEQTGESGCEGPMREAVRTY
jgi:hypothetical protein